MIGAMEGRPISLVRTIPLRTDAVVRDVRAVLERLAAASAPEIVLGVDLRGTGRVSVPVSVRLAPPAPASRRFRIAIEARRTPAAFPRFEGALQLAAAGNGRSTLILAGRYRVPLGPVGRAFDATIARGVAASGLSSFLDRVADELLSDVAQSANAAYSANRRQV